MLPIRDIKKDMVESVSKSKIRPVKYSDFEKVISGKKPLLTKEDLKKFEGRFHWWSIRSKYLYQVNIYYAKFSIIFLFSDF